MTPPSPSPPRIALPLVFSIIAAILAIVVLATPGLMEIRLNDNNGNALNTQHTGPFRACVKSPILDECSNIDTSCKGQFHIKGAQQNLDIFLASASCAELNWMRALFIIAFLTSVASAILAIISRLTVRLPLTSAIVLSIISAIAAVIAMSLTIALFVGEVIAVKDISNIDVTFTYGSTMIIVFTVLHFCAAVAYQRAKRLAYLNHTMTQPLVATTTVYTPPVYTVAVPVAQTAYQPSYQPPNEGQPMYYGTQQQQTFNYPVAPQQPQQL